MIVIHAAGNERLGVGHLSRCHSLATELVRAGVMDVVVVYEATSPLGRRFTPPGLRLFTVRDREAAIRIQYSLLSPRPNAPHILITDLLNLNRDDSNRARALGFKFLVHLNDSSFPDYRADVFVDGDAFDKDQYRNVNFRGSLLCGPSYHIVRPAIVARRPFRPWEKGTVDKVLVCFGGADPGRQTELLLSNLANCGRGRHWTVVIGPAVSRERCLMLELLVQPYVDIVSSPSNIADLILEHDLTVTLGGLTSYETMCLGRPVAAVSWQHMAYYVEKLAGIDLIASLGGGIRAFQTLSCLLEDVEYLKGLACKGWTTIDGNGGIRVATVVKQMVQGYR